MKIVFFGTPFFAASLLTFLVNHKFTPVAVVTRPDRPQGRSQKLLPSPVKELCTLSYPEISLFTPEKASSPSFIETLQTFSPDLFIVAAYGEIMKPDLLSVPKLLCLNVHPSLLPKYRGATPIQSALLNGDTATGVTLIEMNAKMDAGDILDQVTTSLPFEMNFEELEKKLLDLSGPALLRVIEKLQNQTLVKTKQNEAEATFCSKIEQKTRLIDWTKSAEELHNQIRALSPYPGAFCFIPNTIDNSSRPKTLLIKKAKPVLLPFSSSVSPGQTLSYTKGEWIVACGKGALSILLLQLEGKKLLPIAEFMRGSSLPPF